MEEEPSAILCAEHALAADMRMNESIPEDPWASTCDVFLLAANVVVGLPCATCARDKEEEIER